MRASYRRRAQLSSYMSAEEPQTATARPTWLGCRFRCREYSPSAMTVPCPPGSHGDDFVPSVPRCEHPSGRAHTTASPLSLSVIGGPGIQLVPSADSAREPPEPRAGAHCRAWAGSALAISALSPQFARPHQPVLLANRWTRWVLRGCYCRQQPLPRWQLCGPRRAALVLWMLRC